jgi:hypothetical protein
MKICPVGAKLFDADRRTDIMKLIVTFHILQTRLKTFRCDIWLLSLSWWQPMWLPAPGAKKTSYDTVYSILCCYLLCLTYLLFQNLQLSCVTRYSIVQGTRNMYSFHVILLNILLHSVQNTDLCIRILVQIFLEEIHIQKAISLVFNISLVSILQHLSVHKRILPRMIY